MKAHVIQDAPEHWKPKDTRYAVGLFMKENPEFAGKVTFTDDGQYIVMDGITGTEFNLWCSVKGFRTFEEMLTLNLRLQKQALEMDKR